MATDERRLSIATEQDKRHYGDDKKLGNTLHLT